MAVSFRDASAGFVQSWVLGEHSNAQETSNEAFTHLDYIQSELLRHRDVHSKNSSTWTTSQFRFSLQVHVGSIVNNLSSTDSIWFNALPKGQGALPQNVATIPLPLEQAINKLKHRDAVNFTTSPLHTLFARTIAGMGRPQTLVQVPILQFCQACFVAASHV